MKRKYLGKTDLNLPVVSLGGAAFSDIYGSFNEARAVHFIRDCLFRGSNYIDTSFWYGQGTSEAVIGKAVEQVHRNAFYLGTKVGRYEKDIYKMFDYSAERTFASVDASLLRLGVKYVDLIQIHDVSFADFDVILRETLPALKKVVEDGKARYIGIADYDLDLMKAIVAESEVPIAAVLSYAKATLLDNRLQEYIPYFKSRGVGVINAAPTGMGLLTNAGPQPWHPASPEIKALCRQAGIICKKRRVELAQLATWFSLQSDADTTVCGLNCLEQLKDVTRVFQEGLRYEEKSVLRELQMRYFNRGTLHWDNVELQSFRAKMAEIANQPE